MEETPTLSQRYEWNEWRYAQIIIGQISQNFFPLHDSLKERLKREEIRLNDIHYWTDMNLFLIDIYQWIDMVISI